MEARHRGDTLFVTPYHFLSFWHRVACLPNDLISDPRSFFVPYPKKIQKKKKANVEAKKKIVAKSESTLCLRDLGHVRWIALWGRTLGGCLEGVWGMKAKL